jgi:hypothetical protein
MRSGSVSIKKWNADRLVAKAAQTLSKAAPVYSNQAVLLMSNPIWDWDYSTLRYESLLLGGEKRPGRRGVIVREGPRDIVDTGRLLDSMTKPLVIRQRGSTALVIGWTAPYAKAILLGGDFGSYVNPDGAVVNLGYRPGRNWIAETFKTRPPAQVFSEIWRSYRGT